MSNISIQQILLRAFSLLDKSTWTKGQLARDKYGNLCDPCSSQAVCWCSIGYIQKAGCDLGAGNFECTNAALKLEEEFLESDLATFNDTHNFEIVASAWKYALVSGGYLPSSTDFRENIQSIP